MIRLLLENNLDVIVSISVDGESELLVQPGYTIYRLSEYNNNSMTSMKKLNSL